jgi:hypothetical protein
MLVIQLTLHWTNAFQVGLWAIALIIRISVRKVVKILREQAVGLTSFRPDITFLDALSVVVVFLIFLFSFSIIGR